MPTCQTRNSSPGTCRAKLGHLAVGAEVCNCYCIIAAGTEGGPGHVGRSTVRHGYGERRIVRDLDGSG